MTFFQAQVDAKLAAAVSARAEADDATLEASTPPAPDTAADASAAAAATAATAIAAAESKRDLVVGDLSDADAIKATLLADAAIVGASVVEARSTFSAETADAACALSYEAMGVPSDQGHCEASAASARRRRLTQTSSPFDVSVFLSAAQTNQTLIDQGISNLGAASGASNAVTVVVDPVAALEEIPGVDADAVATFATAATASSAASREAATLAAEATRLDEAATTREAQAQTLEANAAALEEDAETARTTLEEATAAVSPPSSGETTDVALIGGAVGGSVAFLLIAFAGFRYRRRFASSRGASALPRFGGSSRRGGFGGTGFGGFRASPTARTEDARRGDDAPSDPEAASRYAPSRAATPPPRSGPPSAAPRVTPGQTEDSPTVRGWAEFPPDSPEEAPQAEAARAAAATAAAAAASNAHTPPPPGPSGWLSAPIPAPMSTPEPASPALVPPAGASRYATPAAGASGYASAPATGPPSESCAATPATVVSTPGYSPSAAFAAFGGEGQGTTPTPAPFPVSSPFDADVSVASETPTATPASLPSPSVAFAGFAAVGTTAGTAAASATPEARASNPFLAAANATVLASSFQTPAAAPHSGADGFGSTASLDDPFGDASDAESDDPFGDADGSELSWSGEDA